MENFKIGDKVEIISTNHTDDAVGYVKGMYEVGDTGEIIGFDDQETAILDDTFRCLYHILDLQKI